MMDIDHPLQQPQAAFVSNMVSRSCFDNTIMLN